MIVCMGVNVGVYNKDIYIVIDKCDVTEVLAKKEIGFIDTIVSDDAHKFDSFHNALNILLVKGKVEDVRTDIKGVKIDVIDYDNDPELADAAYGVVAFDSRYQRIY